MSFDDNIGSVITPVTMGRLQYMQETLQKLPNLRVTSMYEEMVHIFADDDELSSMDILAYDKDVILQENIREAINTPMGQNVAQKDTDHAEPTSTFEEQSPVSQRPPKWQRHVFKNLEEAHDVMMNHRSGLLMIKIHKEHSYAPLSVSKSVFNQISEDIEIFPRIADTILFQGARHGEIEPVTPPAYARILLKPHSSRALGFEISYMLRVVEKSDRQGPILRWSQRQFAVWQRQDYDENTSRWCFLQASTLPTNVVDRYLNSCYEEANENPFDVHTLLITESLATWREYMVCLCGRVEKYGMSFALMNSERERAEDLTLQDLMSLTKDILYTKLSLMSTRHTILRIADLHSVLRPRPGLIGRSYSRDIAGIARVLLEKHEDVRVIIAQLGEMQLYVDSLRNSLVSLLAVRAS